MKARTDIRTDDKRGSLSPALARYPATVRGRRGDTFCPSVGARNESIAPPKGRTSRFFVIAGRILLTTARESVLIELHQIANGMGGETELLAEYEGGSPLFSRLCTCGPKATSQGHARRGAKPAPATRHAMSFVSFFQHGQPSAEPTCSFEPVGGMAAIRNPVVSP